MKAVHDSSSSGSWVTVVALVALVAVGTLVYKNRERFLPAKPKPKAVKVMLSEETENRFFEARDRIVTGKYAEASEILTAIDTDKVPQPTRNWITLQNGLSKFLDGKAADGRAELAKLEKRGPFTKDPREEKLTDFFIRLGHLGSNEEVIKRDLAENFNANSVEAAAFLVFGLKDWALDAFEEAIWFLGEFQNAETPGTEVWLQRYKPLATAYVEGYAAYKAATDAAKDAGSLDRKEAVLKTIAAAKEKVKSQPGLLAKLTPIETELKKQIDAANAETKAATMAAETADRKILDDVKERIALFNEKLQFADAHQIAFTATVDGEKAKEELQQYFKRTQWTAKFKALLIDDIGSLGYTKPVKTKDGTPVVGGFKSADDSEITTTTKATVPWTNFDTATLVAIASDFIAATKDPAAVADRKWALGNFLYTVGKKAEAFPYLREAASANPEYKDGLALLPE